jgi:xanthine dehydrogenase YagR molybdenum-binding subunit
VVQGVGFALLEERIVDDRLGHVMNANLEEYHVPTVVDIPPVEHLHIDVADTNANSTGAKGVGEPPLVPTAPAIANAIFDAIGLRLEANPISVEHLLDRLAARGDVDDQVGEER